MIESHSSLILRARIILPVASPAIEDGAVLIRGNRVQRVGKWRTFGSPSCKVVDLGDQLVMPGLVNAHCHLDYTDMAGQFPPPKHFTEWLKAITETKSGWGYSDYAQSWMNGAGMLVRNGTTTLGDVEAVPELLPDMWLTTPLRVYSFLELIGITLRRSPADLVASAVDKVHRLSHPRCRGALSPHAPYSTLPALLRLAGKTSAARRWPLCVHVAESRVEFDMFRRRRGLMFEWMSRSGRDMSDCGGRTPVEHMLSCGVLNSRLMAIHVNYLGNGDAKLLGSHGANVVHCPRSHLYFGHDPFPLQRLLRVGVNVCLGTDSLASVYRKRGQKPELSLFEEMGCLAAREPKLRPENIVRMATVNGARALGKPGKIGEISRGALADVIALPYEGNPKGAWDAVVHHQGGAFASLIDGSWALPPGLERESAVSTSARVAARSAHSLGALHGQPLRLSPPE